MSSEPVRVLMVEADLEIFRRFQGFLGDGDRRRMTIERADGIVSGMELLSRGGIDAVLLDAGPAGGGVGGTCGTIHGFLPDVPIIVLADGDEGGDVAEALPPGAQDILVKGKVDAEVLVRSVRYAIERLRSERANRLSRRFLDIATRAESIGGLLQALVPEIKGYAGCASVGIRLLEPDGRMPYGSYLGFSREFCEKENELTLTRDRCPCADVVAGRTDPALPWFTPGGSLRVDDTAVFLAAMTEGERGRTCDACRMHGSVSIALIPIKSDGRTIGLVHLADARAGAIRMQCVALLEEISVRLGLSIERMRSRDTLRRSEADYRRLHESMMDAYVRMGLDGRIVESNETFRRMTGYGPDEMKALTYVGLTTEEGRSLDAADTEKQMLDRGYSDVLVREFRRKDGSVFPVELRASLLRDDAGEATGVWALVRDVTERVRLERDLEREKNLLRTLIDNLPDFIYLKDTESRFVLGNIAIARFMGVDDPRDLVGKTDRDFYPRDIAEKFRNDERQVIDSARGMGNIEEKATSPDGTSRWILSTKIPLLDGKGAVTGLVGIGRDVSERKKADGEKELLQSLLLQSQKMEAIGRLAGGVAHDFNNILTGIMGFCDVILLKAKTGEPPARYVHEILKASRRAARLTQGLLDFSRKSISSKRVTDLNELVRRNERMLQRMIGEEIELRFEPWREAVPVLADDVQLEQVLLNLAANARDAMPDGGRITVRVSCESIGPDPSNPARKPGIHARLSFGDTGTGMDEDTKARIFEPFFTTKEIGKGTGMGLSIVWGIVEEHGGFTTVQSVPGRGTAFDVFLPLASPQDETAVTVEEIPHHGGTETVLVVDDEAGIRSVVRATLEGYGYAVVEAADGEDAVRRFAERKDAVDLVLLDVVMPKRGGRWAFDEIRKLRPDMKVVFMSGYGPEHLEKKGVDPKRRSMIRKPFTAARLAEIVREKLDERGD